MFFPQIIIFQRFRIETVGKILKISVFFKIVSFQAQRFLAFHVINWLNFDLEQEILTKISLKFSSESVPQTNREIEVVQEITAKIYAKGGQNDPCSYGGLS